MLKLNEKLSIGIRSHSVILMREFPLLPFLLLALKPRGGWTGVLGDAQKSIFLLF